MRLLLLLFLVLTPPSFATEVVEDPLERQMLEIAKELRCAVCQNQPVSESNADLAKDMRAIIREQLQAGKSKQEIMDYFIQRYGHYILLKPPFAASGAMLWLLPPVLLILIGGFGWMYMRRRMRSSLPAAAELSAEDRARVLAAQQGAEGGLGSTATDQQRE